MKRHGILLLLVLIMLLVGGWWLLQNMHTSPVPHTDAAQNTAPSNKTTFTLPITLQHSLSQGVHTYEGALASNTACGVRSSGITTTGENPVHVTLMLETSSGACENTATTSQSMFEVSFKGSGTGAPVLDTVMLNGQAVHYAVVEKK